MNEKVQDKNYVYFEDDWFLIWSLSLFTKFHTSTEEECFLNNI